MIEDVAWRCSYIGQDFTWNVQVGVDVQDCWNLLPVTGFLWLVLYKGEWDGSVVTPHVSQINGFVQYRQYVMGTDWYGLTLEGGYVQGMDVVLNSGDGEALLEAAYPGCRPKRGDTASQGEWSRVQALLEANYDIPPETSAVLIP